MLPDNGNVNLLWEKNSINKSASFCSLNWSKALLVSKRYECHIIEKVIRIVIWSCFEGVGGHLVLFLKCFEDAKPTKMLWDLGSEHFQALLIVPVFHRSYPGVIKRQRT